MAKFYLVQPSTDAEGVLTNAQVFTATTLPQYLTGLVSNTYRVAALLYASGTYAVYSPTALFAASEPGVWYDPSDLTTLFQDNIGTTPVTAAGQTVGLMLDKSKGLVLGSELVTNGGFASATGWTAETGWSISGGEATKIVSVANANLYQDISIVAGSSYRVTYTLTYSAGGFQMAIGGQFSSVKLASGTYSEIIVAGSSNTRVSAFGNTAFAGSIDNISVKLLAGNHATQATSTQRPTYGINPITGTRNLLTYTEQFDNADWTKENATVSANTSVSPDGTTTADKLIATAVNAGHGIYQGVATVTSSSYTLSAYFKSGEYAFASLAGYDNNTFYGTFDLTLGTVANTTGLSSSSITSVGNGWYRCTISRTATITGTSYWYARPLPTSTYTGFTGDGTSGILIWGAQLELGSTATAYQKVVTQYEVTQAGVQSVSYLAFDGVDDGMVTGTITPAIDKVQVFTGVRKLSNSVAGVIAELSSSFASNNGSVQLTADGGNLPTYLFGSKGTTGVAATATPYVSPITNVVTGLGDIAGDNSTIRVNGIQAATSATDQGTGNYLAYPLYIGRRGGTTLPYNGRLYSLITRFGPNLTDGQITSTESWVNAKTGAY